MKKYCYDYSMPAVTTDCIIARARNTNRPELLLIKRKNEPYQGLWALAGGFVEIDEDLQQSAARELEEETGLKQLDLQQFKTYGRPGRDPRGRTIAVVYYAWLKQHMPAEAGDDAAEVQWFPIDQLPALAFDHHEIILDFIRTMTQQPTENESS
jgi:8-oxo-dGTP diphosphatase